MELEEAKARLKSLYALIESLSDEQKIGKGLPSRVLLDGRKITMAEPQVIDFERSPLLAEFIEKHQSLWESLIRQKWSDIQARELVEYEHALWDKHFG